MATENISREVGEHIQGDEDCRESITEQDNEKSDHLKLNNTEPDGSEMPEELPNIDSFEEDVITESSTRNLNDEERLQLFQKGVEFRKLGSDQHALLCFLGCLRDLKASSRFSAMPECLQSIAEIFANNDDYERAVQFIQAAKMYYETAIIRSHLSTEEDTIEARQRENLYAPLDDNAQSEVAKRANEYEKLSHSCLKEKNIQLALEYCGKATQLRRSHYGDSHPISVKSLDLFTVIYAEMGKMQYSEAVSKLSSSAKTKSKDQEEEKRTDKVVDKKGITRDQDKRKRSSERRVTFDLPDDTTGTHVEREQSTGNVSEPITRVSDPADINSNVEQVGEIETEFHQSSSGMLFVFILLSAGLAVMLTAGWYHASTNYRWPSYAYIKQRLRFYYYYWAQALFKSKTYF